MTAIDAIQLPVSTLPDPYGPADAYASRPQAPRRGGRSFASVLHEQELRDATARSKAQAAAWRQATLSDAIRGLGGSPVSGDADAQELALARLLAGGEDAALARVAHAHAGYRAAARGMHRTGRQLEELSAALAAG